MSRIPPGGISPTTLKKMSRSLTNLATSSNTFHGIVPGKAVLPLGAVTLDVTFRTPEHLRKEAIDFEVVE